MAHDVEAMVERALARVRTVLETTKNPKWAGEVPHRYDDKYLLAEYLTQMAIASALQCLERLGLAPERVLEAREWAKNRSVTLRLRAEEKCTFAREQKREMESEQKTVRTETGKQTKTTSEKVITTVTEYFWRFEFQYEIVLFQGTSEDRAVVLSRRAGSVEIKTGAKTTPRPQSVVRPNIDADLGWLLRHVDEASRSAFAIDRARPECHTPRRNEDIEEALRGFAELTSFCERACVYLIKHLFSAQMEHGLDLSALDDDSVLVPVLPVFEGAEGAKELLPAEYASAFLEEQRRALEAKRAQLEKVFPSDDSVITAPSAAHVVALAHTAKICAAHDHGVLAIEEMLREQLISAIGKELTPDDFAEYMDFHMRKLVKPEFRPLPFSHAVRLPEQYPEGVVGLEIARDDEIPVPLPTLTASSVAPRPMTFPLNAATRVSFLGERHLHAFIAHRFSDSPELELALVARARQFSSFILLVGRIASADVFEPKYGIILQNKDALTIPLLLESIPSAKEFRDAIESLSPEQQRFAKAVRAMQLESTLFGICVIQIEPQLEKLLGLPSRALTKEIKLTQELARLFIEYQIPSDLLSYDGPAEATLEEKLGKVKEYVARMLEMIELAKKKEIEEAQQREAFRRAERDRTPAPQFMGPPMPASAPGAPPPPMLMRSAAAPMAPPAPQAMEESFGSPDFEGGDDLAMQEPAADVQNSSAPSGGFHAGSAATSDPDDYTRIPTLLDKRLDVFSGDEGALRPAILHAKEPWTRVSQKGLLAAPATHSLWEDEQKTERDRAFDLLDALSRSGTLAIDYASLHVVIASTHAFDKTLLDVVIQDNVNPIEKVERSLLIVASTIHRAPPLELVTEAHRERLLGAFPELPDKA